MRLLQRSYEKEIGALESKFSAYKGRNQDIGSILEELLEEIAMMIFKSGGKIAWIALLIKLPRLIALIVTLIKELKALKRLKQAVK